MASGYVTTPAPPRPSWPRRRRRRMSAGLLHGTVEVAVELLPNRGIERFRSAFDRENHAWASGHRRPHVVHHRPRKYRLRAVLGGCDHKFSALDVEGEAAVICPVQPGAADEFGQPRSVVGIGRCAIAQISQQQRRNEMILPVVADGQIDPEIASVHTYSTSLRMSVLQRPITRRGRSYYYIILVTKYQFAINHCRHAPCRLE